MKYAIAIIPVENVTDTAKAVRLIFSTTRELMAVEVIRYLATSRNIFPIASLRFLFTHQTLSVFLFIVNAVFVIPSS